MTDAIPNGSTSDEASKQPRLTPVAAFETLALLSVRLHATLAASKQLTAHGLTPEQFGHLVAVAAEPASPLGKIARRSSDVPGARDRKALIERGLIAAPKTEGDAKVRATLTDEGKAVLSAIEAELEPILASVSARAWRSVPYVANVVRTVSKGVLPAPLKGAARKVAIAARIEKRASRTKKSGRGKANAAA